MINNETLKLQPTIKSSVVCFGNPQNKEYSELFDFCKSHS